MNVDMNVKVGVCTVEGMQLNSRDNIRSCSIERRPAACVS